MRLQEKYRDEFETKLTAFIFEEEEYAPDTENYLSFVSYLKQSAKSDLRREVLVSTILFLHHDFKGVPEQRLVRLYQDAELEKYAFRTIKYGSWYEKAFEFTELGQMQIVDALPMVHDYVDHYSTVLREEAQFAAVRMGGVKELEYLATLKRPISEWQQTRIMQELDEFSQNEMPSFYYLLDAVEDSIIVFGLKLISKYRQTEDPKKLISLMWHENLKVGITAVETLIALDLESGADELLNLFYSHDKENQPLVVRAVGMLGNEDHIPFLKDLLADDNYELVMEATKALIRLGFVLPANTELSTFNKEIYKHARYELVP